MKKIAFALTLCCMILARTFTADAETRWGIVAVGNYSNLKFNQDLISVDKGFGGGAGLMGEIIIPGIGSLVKPFVTTGPSFAFLVSKKNINEFIKNKSNVHLGERPVWRNDGFGNETLCNHTIDIPLNLKFKYSNLNGIENIIAPLAYVGPSFTVHVGDGSKGADAMSYKRIAFGIHVGAGCELFRRVQVSASYTWGITKTLSTIKLDDFEAKNKYWRLQVAYMF